MRQIAVQRELLGRVFAWPPLMLKSTTFILTIHVNGEAETYRNGTTKTFSHE